MDDICWDSPNRVGCYGTPDHHTHTPPGPTLSSLSCSDTTYTARKTLSLSTYHCLPRPLLVLHLFLSPPKSFLPCPMAPLSHCVSLPRRSTTLAWQHHLPHSPSHDPPSMAGYEGCTQPSPADTCTFHTVVFPYLIELYFRKVCLQNIFLVHLITRMNHVINTKWPSLVAHWRLRPCLTYLTSSAGNLIFFFLWILKREQDFDRKHRRTT